ncbi:unnamed protein product, partial [Ilex paraguariensis]
MAPNNFMDSLSTSFTLWMYISNVVNNVRPSLRLGALLCLTLAHNIFWVYTNYPSYDLGDHENLKCIK